MSQNEYFIMSLINLFVHTDKKISKIKAIFYKVCLDWLPHSATIMTYRILLCYTSAFMSIQVIKPCMFCHVHQLGAKYPIYRSKWL